MTLFYFQFLKVLLEKKIYVPNTDHTYFPYESMIVWKKSIELNWLHWHSSDSELLLSSILL